MIRASGARSGRRFGGLVLMARHIVGKSSPCKSSALRDELFKSRQAGKAKGEI